MLLSPKYPLNAPWMSPSVLERVNQALTSQVQQGDGTLSQELTRNLNDVFFKGYINFLTPSCTSSLEIASMAIDIEKGDEIIMPSFNFTSAALSVSKFGGTPVFVDINISNGCIDLEHIESAICNRTKAISWVNYAGLRPNQDELIALAREYDLWLIEDNAHSFGSNHYSPSYGIGDFIVSSFHATKNLQCGEGGHIGIADMKLSQKVQIIREKGTNRSEFIRGQAKKYQWVSEGGSYLLPEICAALLMSQIDAKDIIFTHRNNLIKKYFEILKSLLGGISGVTFFPELVETHHTFFFLLPNRELRNQVILESNKIGIQTASHYEDLASSPHGLKVGIIGTSNEKSIEFSQRILRLPVHMHLSESDVEYISAEISQIVLRIMD